MSQLNNKIVYINTSDYRDCINKYNRSLIADDRLLKVLYPNQGSDSSLYYYLTIG